MNTVEFSGSKIYKTRLTLRTYIYEKEKKNICIQFMNLKKLKKHF